MNPYLMLADIVAIAVLMLCFYVPRKGRRELVSSFLVTNIGVLAVATAMSVGLVAAGLGLGLFGVLSIIRLRSEELSHREIAYYFASLSLGLLGGLSGPTLIWSIGLMALVLTAIAIGDHPRVTAGSQSTEMIIDKAITDPDDLKARVEQVVNGTVTDVSIRRIDMINDSTMVQARFRPANHHGKAASRQQYQQRAGQAADQQQSIGGHTPIETAIDHHDPYQQGTYQGPFEPALRSTGRGNL